VDWYAGYGGAFLYGVWALCEVSFALGGKKGKVVGIEIVESTDMVSLSCFRDSISMYRA
jgi:hypothetical protein